IRRRVRRQRGERRARAGRADKRAWLGQVLAKLGHQRLWRDLELADRHGLVHYGAHSPRWSAEIDRIAEAVASQDLDRQALRRDRIIAVIPARGEGKSESEYRDMTQHRHTSEVRVRA